MNRNAFERHLRVILVALLLAAAGPLFGQYATYNLSVKAFVRNFPDGTPVGKDVTLWGYAVESYDLGNGVLVPGNGVPSTPGPRLTVPAGLGLRVNLTNALPDLPDPNVPGAFLPPPAVSIYIPGQAPPLALGATAPQVALNPEGRIRSFVHETAKDAIEPVAYIWDRIDPGTYLYHSGSHPAVQVQMGLYGALTKNAVEADPLATTPVRAQAYPGAAYEYNQDLLLIYSEVDPVLNAAVADGTYGAVAPDGITPLGPQSTIDYQPKYFLVNGEIADAAFDETTNAPLTESAFLTTASSATLLRFVNASLWDHAPQILGAHVTVLAEDGKLYPYPKQQYSLLLPAGKTLDAVLTPPASTAAVDYPIFDRRLFRSYVPSVLGSMHALIRAEPAPALTAAH